MNQGDRDAALFGAGSLSGIEATPVSSIDYAGLGWESRKTQTIEPGSRFNHANTSETLHGTGQSGHRGDAIWMTSGHHVDAARGYAGQSGKLFVLESRASLNLAVLDELGNQVFPDELEAWKNAAKAHGLDGVKTTYPDFDEVVLFNRSKLDHVTTQDI
ncbi:hypothetical protein [Paraburkholderia sp. Clong3]|uniref:hypothetical protein n=1 Tax=Paraburkholderia sp. Clong3 TaxID=2991061 RepID=UPI003D1F76AA